jgi:uncharacterized protein YceK
MKYNIVLIVFSGLIFSGCASKLTKEGSKTKEIDMF